MEMRECSFLANSKTQAVFVISAKYINTDQPQQQIDCYANSKRKTRPFWVGNWASNGNFAGFGS
jgi:hypothetical protein